MTSDAFDHIAPTLDSPMIIATTRAGDDVDGCLVGFSTQCSIEPPRYLVCLSKKNRTYEIACRASALVVHTLHNDERDRSLARLFGEETGREVDKLERCEWDSGPQGIPALRDCDWFGGPIVDTVDLGDHVGFMVEPDSGRAARTAERGLSLTDVIDLDAGNPV